MAPQSYKPDQPQTSKDQDNIYLDNLKFGQFLANPPPGDEVVITGMGGSFPLSESVDVFAQNLFNKVDLVSDDDSRWSLKHPEIPKRTGKIPHVEKFDAGYFGVLYRSANIMDPMIRVLVEKSVEAVVDAGLNPRDLEGSRTGVFVGACFCESERLWVEDLVPQQYSIMSCTRSMIPNRISYYLKLNGPSHITDTACSSSLYALEHAYRNIRMGRCDAAIVGGCNLCLQPFVSLQFARLGVLSQDGRCKCFDDEGNGYARSEAITAIFLQKSKDAKRIYARVVHAKTNCDGYKEQGITYPSGEMQKRLLKEVYEECGVDPTTLSFLEAHGTGTKVGDPEECAAIDEVFCKGRETPLLVGSVKSNIGHSEASSGLCSITKVVIGMESGYIPPNLHYSSPRKGVKALEEGRLEVVTEKTPFRDNRGLIGVSSFGFGGGNAHILLKWHDKVKINNGEPRDDLPRLVCVSGRVLEAVEAFLNHFQREPLDAELCKLLHSLFSRRHLGHMYRGYTIVSKTGELARSHLYYSGETKPLYFIFNGFHENWRSFGMEMFKLPRFAASIQRIHNVLAEKQVNINITEVLLKDTPKTTCEKILGNISVQIAIVDLLRVLQIYPDGIFGYSLGELVCAYYDEALTLEQTVLAACAIGLALDETEPEYCSYLVDLDIEQINQILPKDVHVTAITSDTSVVLSGKVDEPFVETLGNSVRLGVDPANFRGGFLKMQAKLLRELSKIIPKPKSWTGKWLGNTTGNQFASPEHFVNALVNIVNLKDIFEGVEKHSAFLDVGSGQLELVIKAAVDVPVNTVSFGRASSGNLLACLATIGSLYELGHSLQLDQIYPKVEFPVSRGTAMISHYHKWNHDVNWKVYFYEPMDNSKVGEKAIHINTTHEFWSFVVGHTIDGRNLFPATGYLTLVWEIFATMNNFLMSAMKITFENCRFRRATNLTKDGKVELLVMIHKSTGQFEVIEGGVAVVTGRIYMFEDNELEFTPMPQVVKATDSLPQMMTTKDVYKELRLRGYNYRGQFRGIKECTLDGSYGLIKWEGNWISFMDNMLQLKILQLDSRMLYVPTSIDRISFDSQGHIKFAKEFGEESYLPTYSNKLTDLIRCGGIEIRGLKASSIPRKKALGDPVLERYEFVANFTSLTVEESMRVCMQIALENSWSIKVKGVELVDEASKDPYKPLAPLVQEMLGDQPLIQPEITILSKRTFEDLPGNIQVENRMLTKDLESMLVVGSGLLARPLVLQKAFEALKTNGFLISRENPDFDLSSVDQQQVNILTIHNVGGEFLVFCNKPSEFKLPTAINIRESEEGFPWLSQLQNSVKTDGNLVVFSENYPKSGVLGLVNCLRREPGGQNIQCVFIMDAAAPPFDPYDKFYMKQLRKKMAVNVLRNGQWGTYRHLPLERDVEVPGEHFYANTTVRGDLSSLRWLEGRINPDEKPSLGRKTIYVYYAALNFRDIMTASGKISNDVINLNRLHQEVVQGFEFAGRDASGQRYCGMIPQGALSTVIEAEPETLWEIPDDLSMEEGVTIPVVYSTCHFALFMRAHMKRGESILIHSGTGGIGLAAIHLALFNGCTVFTTVGTPEKRAFIKQRFPQITDDHIGNSRDISFEQMVMRGTNGRGVDLVLNSLAEEKLLASVRCLAQNGRFAEIGKYDLANNNELNLLLLKKGASFHGVMLDMFFNNITGDKLSVDVEEMMKTGAFVPLVRTIFHMEELEQAFRYMTSGKHIGKVLIQVRQEEPQRICKPSRPIFRGLPRFYCDPNKSYVIVGGLGGFGLELADFLVLRGARNLVLTSRHGVKTGYQALRISIWQTYSVNVKISVADVTTKEGCEEMLRDAEELAPVWGLFNLAVVLKDALLENQTVDSFRESFGPKAYATEYLDQVSRVVCPQLRHFVVFSSVSCGRGNAGQSNYGMANSIMERICEQRRNDGLPALAIEWGAIGEVGLVAEMQEEHIELEIGGTLQQRIASCCACLDMFLRQDKAVIVSSMVVAEKRGGAGGADNLVDAVANILGLKDLKAISLHATLAELGMDSMTAVEIKQTLEREFEIFLTAQDIRSMTFARLIEIQEEKDLNALSLNKKDSTIPAMQMIVRLMGDQNSYSLHEVPLESRIKPGVKAPKVLLIPGLEQVVSSMSPLAVNLNVEAVGLQLGCKEQQDTILEMANYLLPFVRKHLTKTEPFYLVGYSFGVCILLELVAILESEGYTGMVICIDGSPHLMQALTKILDVESETLFQTSLVCQIMSAHMCPYEVIERNKEGIFKCNSFKERIQLAQNIGRQENIRGFNEEHQYDMALGLYKRIKSLIDYKPTYTKLNSKVILLKAKHSSLQNLPEDYMLGETCGNPVDVKVYDANHVNILDNLEMADYINALVGVETIFTKENETMPSEIGGVVLANKEVKAM